MVTSKYCKFGYANVWNYLKNMLQLTPHYFVPLLPYSMCGMLNIKYYTQ